MLGRHRPRHQAEDPQRREVWLRLLLRGAKGSALLLGYILLSAWLFWRLVAHPASVSLSNGGDDTALFVWWLRWAPFALSHSLNPFYTHYWNGPLGIDSMWNTSVLAIGVLLSPITWLFGAVVTFNVASILGPGLSAFTASRWLRRHVGPGPAFVGGLVFGFSPFIVQQGLGHIHLTWLFLVPVILMLVEDIVWRSSRPWWPQGPLLGVAVAIQWFISTEVLVITAFAVLACLVLMAPRHGRELQARWRPILAGGGVALLLAGLLCAVPLADQYSSAHVIHGPVQVVNRYQDQPRDLIEAPASLRFHTHHSSRVAGRLGVEDGLFMGIPLLSLLALIVVVLPRRTGVLLAAGLAVVFFVLSLGGQHPRAHGAGRSGLYTPWQFLEDHFRVLINVLPARFAIVVWLAIAYLFAVGLDFVATTSWRKWRFPAVGLLLACLVPLIPAGEPAGRIPATPRFFTTGAVRVLPAGQNVLLIPVPVNLFDAGFLWQAASNMRFEQVGSLALRPIGPNRAATFSASATTLVALFGIGNNGAYFSGPFTPLLRQKALAAIIAANVRSVVVGPSRAFATEVRLVTSLLGRPADVTVGGVEVWRLGAPTK